MKRENRPWEELTIMVQVHRIHFCHFVKPLPKKWIYPSKKIKGLTVNVEENWFGTTKPVKNFGTIRKLKPPGKTP